MRHLSRVLAIGLMVGASTVSAAQERLVGHRTVGGGVSIESIRFSDRGVAQAAFAGFDTVRITSVDQLSMPVTVITPLGGSWRLDVTALYAHGRVTYRTVDPDVEHTGSLAGMSDVRLRATGRFATDGLTLTLGANAPTGRTSLTQSQFSTLRIVAAPVLGMGSPPVGGGPSGTVGIVFARQAGPWSLAFGTSYEHRGRYQPVAALTAGAPSADFRPGGVVRASIGGDRIVGPHRLSVALAADLFSDDKLRGVTDSGGALGVPVTLATVRLGPVFTGDTQLLLATNRLRELIVYASYLWRTAYARDGRTAEGSSGQYLAGGLRAAVPLVMNSDLILAGEGRWHSGLGVDQGLPTSGVRSISMTVGWNARRGLRSLQPFLRASAGSLRQRGAATAQARQPFTSVVGGLVLITRF